MWFWYHSGFLEQNPTDNKGPPVYSSCSPGMKQIFFSSLLGDTPSNWTWNQWHCQAGQHQGRVTSWYHNVTSHIIALTPTSGMSPTWSQTEMWIGRRAPQFSACVLKDGENPSAENQANFQITTGGLAAPAMLCHCLQSYVCKVNAPPQATANLILFRA